MRKSGVNLLLLVMVLFGALAPILIVPGALSADEVPASEMRPDAITISSKYPSATGSADTTFMFQVDMLYRLIDTDYQNAIADTGKLQSRVFDFELSGPEGWEFFVAESSWKLDTRIAAMQLRALGVPQTLVVVATAPWWTNIEPGEYPIELTVTAGDIEDSLTLKAVVTAWYGLEASTATGRLNTKTTAGSPAYVDVKVVNTGSAPLNKVSVSSTKPSGIANEQWTVRFEPDVIKDLAPGEEQQLRAAITPPEKAISGDYFVTLSLASEPALSDFDPSLEIRVSIETRPTWVVVGVAVVVLAFGALMYAFYVLRQR